MRWSFRTNGNFVDFVHTDETDLARETTVFHLHNTSKCVAWSLPSDTTRISFTIYETKYNNILITDIDFDGTAMNSQDDFETGIEAMFPGLAGGGEGGSSYLSATVTLTDAQILALPTTPTTLVSAQGANKAIIPTMVVLHSTIVANYTNIDASDGEVGISISGAGYILQPLINRTTPDTISLVTTLLNTDGAIFRIIDSQNDVVGAELVISGVVPASANNQPLVIESYNGGGNYTGGNAANTLKVTVYYVVVDL